MSKEIMTPRERWLAVLNRQKPDRVPMDYWGTPETGEMLKKHFGCDDLWDAFRKLHIDKVVVVEPEYVGPPLKPGHDYFGCKWKGIPYGNGVYDECVMHPLARFETVVEIEGEYCWPSPDWFYYGNMMNILDGKEEYPAEGPFSEPFYIYKNLRGQEQAFIDMAIHPEMVEYILDKLFEYDYTRILRTLETISGRLVYNQVAEDLGCQQGLMYSIEHIERFIFPRMKRLMKLLHDAGVFVMTHSDGAVRDVLPRLIECGMDILNPVQWRCAGMERKGLKRDFGEGIIFHGGMDNQQTMPFGSIDDVRQEVLDNFSLLGEGGGYILAPCHNLQPVTAVENIVTMYETGYVEGFLV